MIKKSMFDLLKSLKNKKIYIFLEGSQHQGELININNNETITLQDGKDIIDIDIDRIVALKRKKEEDKSDLRGWSYPKV